MKLQALLRTTALGAGLAFAPIAATGPSAPAGEAVAATLQQATDEINLGINKGTLLRLDQPVTNVFVANAEVADVQVRSSRLVYVFGVGAGETSLYATNGSDQVVYSATLRVANNLDQINEMLKMALPDAKVDVQPLNGLLFLNGTVASPQEAEEAARLVKGFVGEGQTIVNKIRTATPIQVNLQVKIAEVSRELIKELGVNLATRDTSGGFLFGIGQGRDFVDISTVESGVINPVTGLPFPLGTAYEFNRVADAGTSLEFAGKLFGLDAAAAIDLLEEDGVVTVLAEPNLTAISGETASFLAGGEYAIPAPSDDGRIVIEYKEYGVGLSFTPTVLSGDRINMRVRPEVSELTSAGAITVNGISVPGLSTRRAETTVELGSGQSFMIAGLLQNGTNVDIDKAPFLGDIPILGALFKSDRYRRRETELVIVVTPYLVKPVSADKISLPTDGYQAPTDLQRWLLGRSFDGTDKPKPVPAVAPVAAPASPTSDAGDAAAPGFSYN